jgi:hypothetical protein
MFVKPSGYADCKKLFDIENKKVCFAYFAFADWLIEYLAKLLYSLGMTVTDEIIGKAAAALMALGVLIGGYFIVRDYFVSGERGKQASEVMAAKVGADTVLDAVKQDNDKVQAVVVDRRGKEDAARAVRSEAALKQIIERLNQYEQFQKGGACDVPADVSDWMRVRHSVRSNPAGSAANSQPGTDKGNK